MQDIFLMKHRGMHHLHEDGQDNGVLHSYSGIYLNLYCCGVLPDVHVRMKR